MSDLQCPATFHVFGPSRTPERFDLVHGAPIVAVYAAASRRSAVPEEVGDQTELLPLPEHDTFDAVLLDLSDLYRGCHVVVLTDEVGAPLRSEDDELVVRIDADGVAVDRTWSSRCSRP